MFSQMLAMVSKGGEEGKNGDKNNISKAEASRTKKPSSSTSMANHGSRTSATSGITRPQIKTSLSAKEQEEQRQRIKRLKAARLGSQPPSKVQKKSSAPPPSKKRASTSTASTTRKVTLAPAPVAPSRAPAKKLNFREIMKQAEQVDSEKLKVTVKVKGHESKDKGGAQSRVSKIPDPAKNKLGGSRVKDNTPISRNTSGPISSKSRMGSSSGPISSASRMRPGSSAAIKDSRKPLIDSRSNPPSQPSRQSSIGSFRSKSARSNEPSVRQPPSRPSPASRTPAPIAQPMQKLVDKRKKKAEVRRGYYDDDDESLDDFIVDDDDEEDDYGRGGQRSGGRGGSYDEDQGYDRDEIWKMFNRGKRRSDFVDVDDDYSDMEATGAELFREEQCSLRVAREEDEAEERELKRLAEEKKQRKKSRH